jgi:rod shape-determining protein MreD
MKYLIYTLAIVFLIGLNFGLFGFLQVKGIMPNLLFLFVLCASLERRQSEDFLFVSLLSGLFLDVYSGVFFGSFTVTFLVLSMLIQLLLNNFLALELTWKFILIMFLAGFVFLNFSLWLYMGLAYKLKLVKFYFEPFSPSAKFVWELAFNFILLYPMVWFTAKIKNAVAYLKLQRHKVT